MPRWTSGWLRADVPVAAYLSGGLDSSIVCAIAQRALGGTLSTFSVRFPQGAYDERPYQDEVASRLATRHVAAEVGEREIGELLPTVIEHAEQVVLRSAPAPLLRLSATVQQHGTRVVLTGEGSDEIFLGYDLYKETKIRQFWGRSPGGTWRAAHLVLEDLLFIVFEPPATRPESYAGEAWITSSSPATRDQRERLPRVPPGYFCHAFFASNWNAHVFAAARDARLDWA